MHRSQMLIIVLGFLLLVYSYLISRSININEKITEYQYILEFYHIYNIKNDINEYKQISNLNNSIIYPFYIIYNCTSNRVLIKNPSNSTNVIVLSPNLKEMQTRSNTTHISFIPEYKRYVGSICYFEGYIVESQTYNTQSTVDGDLPIAYSVDPTGMPINYTVINNLFSLLDYPKIRINNNTIILSTPHYTVTIDIQ